METKIVKKFAIAILLLWGGGITIECKRDYKA